MKNLINKVNKFKKEYMATVVSNDDPLRRGRLQVTVDAIMGDIPFWTNATLLNGSVKLLIIPEPGDIVSVKFRNEDIYSGEWSINGNSINGTEDVYVDPKKYGLSDNQGNCVMIDRATNNINIAATGDYVVTVGGNMNIVVTGNAVINVSGNTDITTPACNIHADAVNLGDGGQPIARVGDEVEVIDTDAEHGGTWKGKITKGGTNTSI